MLMTEAALGHCAIERELKTWHHTGRFPLPAAQFNQEQMKKHLEDEMQTVQLMRYSCQTSNRNWYNFS